MKITSRHVRAWARNPCDFLYRAKKRLSGVDAEYLTRSREEYRPGSSEWLALTEIRYGGFQAGGVRSQVNQGGDRMSSLNHDYGMSYAKFLKPFLAEPRGRDLTVVEIGILNGSGLAIWCGDLFPEARVIGLDIDLSNFLKNRPALEAKGAFGRNSPEVHSFNQLDGSSAQSVLKTVLGDGKVDIVIDDGCHTRESVEITFAKMRKYLAPEFVYFIEDNFDTYDWLAPRYPDYRFRSYGEMTVARNR